jgi:hypothetical protein
MVSSSDDGQVVRRVVTDQLEQDPHEAERHVRRLLGHGARHPGTDGVIGPEELGVPVDQVEGLGHLIRG